MMLADAAEILTVIYTIAFGILGLSALVLVLAFLNKAKRLQLIGGGLLVVVGFLCLVLSTGHRSDWWIGLLFGVIPMLVGFFALYRGSN